MRPLRGLLVALGFASSVFTAVPADAAGTKTFRQTTAKDFEEGEATGTQILPTGDVVPGLKTAKIPGVEAGFVWCAATSPDGATAYFGTGDPGRIYALPVRAAGDKDGPARKVVDLEAPWITALVARPDGSLIAATTPGGKLFTIDPVKGVAREFAKLTVEHVWALVHDAKTGTTYAGSGGGGKIVAIDKTGKARVHWDSGDKHVVSLADAGGGVLLAGTSEEALLYRVRPDGKAEAVHDFEADEVRAIVRANGATYLAVNDFDRASEAPRTPTPQEAAAAKGTKVVLGGSSPASAGLLPRPGQVKAKAAVYRLEDDGRIEQVFAVTDGYFTHMVADGAELYVAAGVDGKVYRLAAERTAAVAVDLPERQALALVRSPDGFLVASGDAGAVFRARSAANAEATYLSKVLDGEYPTRWGHLRVTGSTGLTVETRSGNTAKPDKNWGEWKRLDAFAFSGDEAEGQVASAPARYLQYRVTIPGRDAVLREVVTYYLPQNQRARVTEVTLADTGSPSTPSSNATARAHASILKLRWKVENPDADELIYKLWYRQESEPVWRPLGGPDPLTKAEYDWNTDYVPDGRYLVRVWASDARVVAQDRALDNSFTSPPFLVDNTRPDVIGLLAQVPSVTGRAKDDASAIAQIEYSINGGEWRPATPSDGILDQKAESFSVKLPQLPAGTHIVNVRAWDSADNVGAGKVVITTK